MIKEMLILIIGIMFLILYFWIIYTIKRHIYNHT